LIEKLRQRGIQAGNVNFTSGAANVGQQRNIQRNVGQHVALDALHSSTPLACPLMIETAMAGHDGALNAASALDGKVSLNKGIVQVAGSAGTIEVNRLRRLANELEPFRSLLIRHEQVLFAQSQQSAACNARHSVEARMCRWLLYIRDLAGSDDLMLTQEFLAQMLSVRRPSVSIVASPLQKAGLIKYSRGRIRVLDVKGLQKRACECYGTVKAHYQRLLSD
jgi:hypothetical protein